MNLEETTQLYASVLRQLLPVGGYDASPNTEALAVDVYAHAKLLAQADIDAKRLLKFLEELPPELLPEYELEYGLPLKCTVNASRTIEERLQILKWVRTSRNVLNRAYLEQLLAIFGVVLIDVVKFKPLLCTAACDSPVNTEQLRYKVFLRLQYPMNADMSCIVENYLPDYLRIEWMVDMPWGDWILNPGVTVNTNGIAHYTAYKTNQREYYDSYANFDLTTAIVRSLHDVDMQQWQAVKDALNQLIGNYTYTFDNFNDQIKYTIPGIKGLWAIDGVHYIYDSGESASRAKCAEKKQTYRGYDSTRVYALCTTSTGYNDQWTLNYNSNKTKPSEDKVITFALVAEKIISNTSSSNQAISLLAEAYLDAVANSIFSTNQSKQFVKLSDLTGQFELNKTLRT